MKSLHYTEDVYVVYKMQNGQQVDNCIVEVVERGVGYPRAIWAHRELSINDKECRYDYMRESEFDKAQENVRNEMQENNQIGLF